MTISKLTTIDDFKKLLAETELIKDNIPGLIFYKDDKNNLFKVIKYFADAHDTLKENLAGKNCFDIYPKDIAQKYLDDDLEVIKSGKPKLNIEEPWEKISQREISNVVGITEVTLHSRYRELVNKMYKNF